MSIFLKKYFDQYVLFFKYIFCKLLFFKKKLFYKEIL